MNSAQRRKWTAHKHRTMPLGSECIVRGFKNETATIFKHDSVRPHVCIVKFAGGVTKWVPIKSVKMTARHKAELWYPKYNVTVQPRKQVS